jgi:anti-sigma factor RsiW
VTVPIPIGDDDLQAYLDRRLKPERMAAVAAYLAVHPDQAARLVRYAEQASMLAAALQAKLEEPVPCRLRVAGILARQRRRRAGQAARAAAVLLVACAAGTGGWFGHAWVEGGDQFRAATESAVAAYQTFSVEVRHPVEVRAEEGAHLQQWLSNRLQRPLTPPDLAPLGYRLIGGRVLPAAAVPAAQLMYDDGHGGRLTVYVQPLGIEGEEFRYTKQGDVRTVVWAERRMVLAVTGRVPQAALMAAAQLVRGELERRAAP